VVALPRRSWRPLAAPAAFLAAATLAVLGVRALLSDPHHPARSHPAPKPAAAQRHAATNAPRRTYVIRAGDTLEAVAARTGVPVHELRKLNPNLQPTALFIGQRIRLR